MDNEKKNTLIISEDDYWNKLCPFDYPYHTIKNKCDCDNISLRFYKELLDNEDYFQKLLKIFENESLDFSICHMDFENCPCYFDTFFEKRQLIEGLKLLYDELELDNIEKKKCEDLVNLFHKTQQKNSTISKYKCLVDNKEYELSLSTINQLVNLSEEEFNFLCNNKEVKEIEEVPKEIAFYIILNYFDENKDQYIMSEKINENLNKINSYQYIDHEALNKFLICEDTIYKDVQIDKDLRKEVIQGLPEEASDLEKAIYIYIKMCKIFSYDDEYFAAGQKGPLAEKHKNVEYINQLSRKNKEVVCYEFNAIFTKFLSELGINFKSHYNSFSGEADYGNSHVFVEFRSSKFLVRADAVTAVLNSDLINAKLNQSLCGLECLNQNKETQEEFANVVEKMYHLIMDQENSKSYLEQDMTFEDVMNAYRNKTNNLLDLSIKDRIELLTELVDDKNLSNIDSWGYMRKLIKILFTKEELGIDTTPPQVGLVIVGNNIVVEEEEHKTTTAIIYQNKEENQELNLDQNSLDYYIYNPRQPIEKNDYNEMLAQFQSKKYYYLNELTLPGINKSSLQQGGKSK